MCLAILKPYGKKMPKKNVIDAAFRCNSDGAGFAWVADGMVRWEKGFMNVVDLKAALKKRQFGKNDLVLLHFRQATAGGVSAEMCHPFPVTSDEKLLTETTGTASIVMIHNGILGKGEPALSDTALFVRDRLAPLGPAVFHEGVSDLIEDAAHGNKLAFINGDGQWFKTGRGWEEHGGVYFSNDYYHVYLGEAYDGYDPWEGIPAFLPKRLKRGRFWEGGGSKADVTTSMNLPPPGSDGDPDDLNQVALFDAYDEAEDELHRGHCFVTCPHCHNDITEEEWESMEVWTDDFDDESTDSEVRSDAHER